MKLPGDHFHTGFWPALWTMGNLGRAGYMESTQGEPQGGCCVLGGAGNGALLCAGPCRQWGPAMCWAVRIMGAGSGGAGGWRTWEEEHAACAGMQAAWSGVCSNLFFPTACRRDVAVQL